jgi:hypothetical protein
MPHSRCCDDMNYQSHARMKTPRRSLSTGEEWGQTLGQTRMGHILGRRTDGQTDRCIQTVSGVSGVSVSRAAEADGRDPNVK